MKNSKKQRDEAVDILPPEEAAETQGSAAQDRLRMPPVIEHNPVTQRLKRLWSDGRAMFGGSATNMGNGIGTAGRQLASWPHRLADFGQTLAYRLFVAALVTATLALVGYGLWQNRTQIDVTAPSLPMADVLAILDKGRAAGAAVIARITDPAPNTAGAVPPQVETVLPKVIEPKVIEPEVIEPEVIAPQTMAAIPQQPMPADDVMASSMPDEIVAPVDEPASDVAANPKAIAEVAAKIADTAPSSAAPIGPPAEDALPAKQAPQLLPETGLAALLVRVESGSPYMTELARARETGALSDAEYEYLYAYAGFGIAAAATLQADYGRLRDRLASAPPDTPPGWLDWLARHSNGLMQLRPLNERPDERQLRRLDRLVAQQDFHAALAELDDYIRRQDSSVAKADLRRWRADVQAHIYVAPTLGDIRQRILAPLHTDPHNIATTERQPL